MITIHSDINECELDELNDCHDNATCNNTIGNYTCECMNGYRGDGLHCQGNTELLLLHVYGVNLEVKLHLSYRHQ